MKLLYVAHKIRDPRGPWFMLQHMREGEAVALALWQMGAAVICPGKNTEFFDGAAPDEVWLKGDLEMVKRCDAVVMSPNWTTSKGAHGEKEFAEEIGKPVFYWPQDRATISEFIASVRY
jgi:nucleoside 2-deoxyribosyltransferase